MGEVMTMEQLKRDYDQEWVLLEDPVSDDEDWTIAGRLLFHSPDHDKLYERAMEIRPKHFGVFFMGPPDDESVLVPWYTIVTDEEA